MRTLVGLGVYVVANHFKRKNDRHAIRRIIANIRKPPEKRELITDGMYAHIRHPIYQLQNITTAGALLLNPTWYNCALFAVTVAAGDWLARTEERKNSLQFGKRYDEYCAGVPRWVPTRVYEFLGGIPV